jgi:hypothetical protein
VSGACILTEADIASGRDDDCSLHDHEVDYDEMSLSDLMALARERDVDRYAPWTDWLEDYYDPAKSALIALLDWHADMSKGIQDRAR